MYTEFAHANNKEITTFSINRENIADSSYVEPIEGERLLSYAFLMNSFRKLLGSSLTVIDASIQDPRQNKAIKDLIRKAYSSEIAFVADFAFDQEILGEMAEEALKNGEMIDIEHDVDKVIGLEE